jgi:two-component system sensor histidine kinase PhoQ
VRSLNTRVAVSAALVLAVFVALSAYALERAFRDSARNARQERLLAQVYLLMAAAEVDPQGRLTLSDPPPEPRLDLPGSGLYAAIVDARGGAVWRSRSALSSDPPIGTERLSAGVSDFRELPGVQGRRYFVQRYGVSWATPGGAYPFTFGVAEDLAAFDDQISVYRRSLWGWLGAMALLLLAGQWLTLRWGLAPLRGVAAELKRLEQGRQQQIAGDYPSEVKALTDNLNALLAHERGQQKRYREALADLAHSLKTPLALVRGELRKASVDGATAGALEEQVERMDRIVGYHLQRASTSGRAALSAPQPLRPAVRRIVDALRKVHADKPIEVEIAVEDELRFRGDEGDLTELLGNVLDNAFKWCRRRVRVGASRERHLLRVCVEDDGAGISAADAERVLHRGVRADESLPGHGIGLAVTRDIVAAYDGRIEIGRGALGGAAVTLLLPAG